MNHIIKQVAIFSLVSSTSLTSYGLLHDTISLNQNVQVMSVKERSGRPVVKALKINVPTAKLSKRAFKPFIAKKIHVMVNNVDANLDGLYKDLIGQEITSEIVTNLSNKVIDHYMKQGYLLPQIYISEHFLKDGFLELNVTFGNIDDVLIVGEGENNKLIQEYAAKIVEEEHAKIGTVQKYLALMNKLPGYDAHYQLKKEGNDNVLMIYTTKKKAAFYAGLDNYGTNDLGKYQGTFIAEVYSPYNRGESLMVHGSTTNQPDRLNAYGVGYSQPLNNLGTKAHLAASHSEDNSSRNEAVSTSNNKSDAFRIALSHPLYLRASQDFEIEMGSNYREYNSYTNSNNVAQHETNSKYWTGDVGLKYSFKDMLNARSSINITFTQGIDGKFYNYLNDAPLPKKHYNITSFNLYREQFLPKNFSLFAHMGAKYSANKVLPDSEKAVLGGREFGRGYDFATLDGTKMFAASLEARYTHTIDENKYVEHIQPYLFHDIGHVGKQNSDTTISKLRSVGGGVRFKLSHAIDLGVEVAEPLKKNYTVDGDATKARTKYSFFINKAFEF